MEVGRREEREGKERGRWRRRRRGRQRRSGRRKRKVVGGERARRRERVELEGERRGGGEKRARERGEGGSRGPVAKDGTDLDVRALGRRTEGGAVEEREAGVTREERERGVIGAGTPGRTESEGERMSEEGPEGEWDCSEEGPRESRVGGGLGGSPCRLVGPRPPPPSQQRPPRRGGGGGPFPRCTPRPRCHGRRSAGRYAFFPAQHSPPRTPRPGLPAPLAPDCRPVRGP